MADVHALRYTEEHEWILVEGDTLTVGITAHAAEQLGDVVYVDLPDVGDDTTAGAMCGEIESTKSVGELFAPITGTVFAVNEAVEDDPELVNREPFDGGWLIKLNGGSIDDIDTLSFDEYEAFIAEH